MHATTHITQADGVQLVVPDSLEVITPYVLMEQEDWFEDEVRFLRGLIQPGQQVVDVGANYGVYAMSMAKVVGPQGRVWAFEPASETARCLTESSALNGFGQVVVRQVALSSESGTAQLALDASPECNALLRGQAHRGEVETVPVLTLDEEMASQGWQGIDFLKLDAAGEELRILQGGHRFFADMSPLVLCGVRTDDALDEGLVRGFAELGYDAYRLVPGLGVLVPFEMNGEHDSFVLNLFFCKPDRAERLAQQGLLLTPDTVARGRQAVEGSGATAQTAWAWPQTLARLPYGQILSARWQGDAARGQRDRIESALAWHAMSRSAAVPMAERYAALRASCEALSEVCQADPAGLRLASLARVASEHGDRAVAVKALRDLATRIIEHKKVDLSEPFLAPLERFDTLPPGESGGNWVLAGVLEGLELLDAFSSFYKGASSLERLRTLQSLGYASPEMFRRLKMVEHRLQGAAH